MRGFLNFSFFLGVVSNYFTVSGNADASVGRALLPGLLRLPGVGAPHAPDFFSREDRNHSCSHASAAANCNAIGIIGTKLAEQSGDIESLFRNQTKIEEQVVQLASSTANLTGVLTHLTSELGEQQVDFSLLEKEVDHLGKVETEHQQDLSDLKAANENISADLTLLRDDLTEQEKSAQALKEKVERALVAIMDKVKLNEGNLDKVMNSSADDEVSIGELKNQSTETMKSVSELVEKLAVLMTSVQELKNSSVVSQQESEKLQRLCDTVYSTIAAFASLAFIAGGVSVVIFVPVLQRCCDRIKRFCDRIRWRPRFSAASPSGDSDGSFLNSQNDGTHAAGNPTGGRHPRMY